MGFISTERVAEIRDTLKKKFPDVKFSVKKRDYSGVIITILKSPYFEGTKYHTVNEFNIERRFHGKEKKFLLEIANIANEGVKYYDTADYGTQPSHYIYIHIGKNEWNNYQPHICTAPRGLEVRDNCGKTQLVLVDRDVLGYIQPEAPFKIAALRTTSQFRPQIGSFPIDEAGNMRLAGKADFDLLGVNFQHYANDPQYLHADNVKG
jgi:hypothetical protein